MAWWLWVLFGLVLLILEVQTFGGFYLMFFGVGAVLVGLLVALGAVEAAWLQWLFFSVLSVAALVLFRRPILRKLAPPSTHKVDSLVGETAVASEDIPSGEIGKAELRGTVWNAHNAGPGTLHKDTRCRVERIDGLTLWVRAE
ncbi:MAG: NfeD family protein [Deltaproteobacteria bacterium]|nr:NfeD family protein [Deltaproteobacteria bacterium]